MSDKVKIVLGSLLVPFVLTVGILICVYLPPYILGVIALVVLFIGVSVATGMFLAIFFDWRWSNDKDSSEE